MGNIQTVATQVVGNYAAWDVDRICGDNMDVDEQPIQPTHDPIPEAQTDNPPEVVLPATNEKTPSPEKTLSPFRTENGSPTVPAIHSSDFTAPTAIETFPDTEEAVSPRTVKQEYKIRGRRVVTEKEKQDTSSEDLPPSPVRLPSPPSGSASPVPKKTLGSIHKTKYDKDGTPKRPHWNQRTVEIIDSETYSNKPTAYFFESPRRSKRVSQISQVKEEPLQKKRRRNSGAAADLQETSPEKPPKTEPRRTGTTPLANYGATTTRATPSQAAKQKVKKTLKF